MDKKSVSTEEVDEFLEMIRHLNKFCELSDCEAGEVLMLVASGLRDQEEFGDDCGLCIGDIQEFVEEHKTFKISEKGIVYQS